MTLPVFRQRSELSEGWIATIAKAALRRPEREFATIVRNVSFRIDEGDRVALLGLNGSGKSTLLHLLTGAYRPTEGSLEIEGSRQALMNISLGFNADATVLENIYLRATAMGMQIGAIQPHIGSILDFAGVAEKAVDRLRTLSAGQRMRLGFAISTSVQHDIMLLDEWIGTGDAEFLKKARDRLQSRVDGSRIVVVASHNLKLVRRLCNRAILLHAGEIKAVGATSEVIAEYRSLMDSRSPDAVASTSSK
ncbi:ABC transporter ATP-binding protein [Lysobacter zhanggongensis]|uniref:ATP-binding cassette domain-containing protein n=1 Tax=Lysobacter zhanggongensis TaxID=1774951 RepID=A0ABU7YNA4_9GAMM